jgi:hypothetical protein
MAEGSKKYQVSLRYAYTSGILVFEKYSSIIADVSGADQDPEIDTPGAFGLALKGDVNWYFRQDGSLTLGGPIGGCHCGCSLRPRQP